MKKYWFIGLLILAVVLVVSCAPPSNGESGSLVGQAIGQIQANSCDKDATCEMKSADVSGAAYINSAKIGSSAQNRQPTIIIDVEKAAFHRRAEFSQGIDIFGDVRVQPQTTVDILGLRGQGNAFVCVDTNGQLFRSSVPCPEQDGCWDRDGGNDQNSKATVSGLDFNGEYQERVDYCSLNGQPVESCRGEGCVLWEGGCAALDGGPRVTAGPFNCPNDCINGACR